MYGWIWGKLPGGLWWKAAQAVALLVAVVILLFLWVFPWIAPWLPFQQQTVGG